MTIYCLLLLISTTILLSLFLVFYLLATDSLEIQYTRLKFGRTSEDQLWEEDPTLVDFKIISFDFDNEDGVIVSSAN